VIELLEYFASDLRGADAAFAAREARTKMIELGLRDILDTLLAHGIDDTEVPRHVEYAVLKHWLGHQLRYDRRLQARSGDERDSMVEQYRTLDHEVIDESVFEIIAAANDRKPASNIGQSGLIR